MSRRDEILDALISMFQQEGLSKDFTIKELAEKVNIGKSTIYEYFKTKDEILQEALCRVIDTSVDAIQNAEMLAGTFEEQVKSEFIRLFNIAKNSRFLLGLVSPNTRVIPEKHGGYIKDKVKGIQSFYQERFASIFIKGITEGVLNPTVVEENALLVYSMVVGSILTLANSNLEISANVDIDEYINKVYNSIIKICN